MSRYTQEQLEMLKRKDLIALCKEHEIKCVGKNAELIEKLLELKGETMTDEDKTIEENQIIAEDAKTEEDIPEVITAPELVEQAPTVTEPEIGDKHTDGVNESIIKETPEPQEECPTENIGGELNEDKPEEQPCNLVEPLEQCAPSPLTRRLSVRLSAAHLKKHTDFPKPKPSSLNQSSVPKASQKENARPSLFNKNISHIPTLKERVSKIASLPTAVKRPATTTSAAAKRPKYDPRESLKKPLTYKPYTGPIKKHVP